MRRMGKWLAVLLSVTMLTGTAPVYGADISVESEFSSGTTDGDVLSDEPGETEVPDESVNGDAVNDEQEIIEEPDSDEVEVSSDELTDGQDDCTGDVNIEDPDEDTAEISFEDQQEVGAGETKEYLKDLSVYSGYGVKDPLEMTRREDLDETYGGKTYTVEIGSSYNSNGFYVTADLGADAPQGSTIQLSACDLDGKIVESEIITTGYTDGKRYNFSNIFTKDNGKRAVYTVTAGTEADSQTYKIVVLRRLDLSMIIASLGTDALGGAINIITKQEKKNYLDVSYGIGSFHTHKADLNAQFVEPKTGLIIRPTVGVNYSKNDYRMKDVQMRDESGDNFIYGNPKRFHDDYFSLLGQIEIGVANKSWADAFFVSASYSKTDKELQTGSVQDKVYGMAEKNSDAWNISAHYQKRNFILKNMQLNAALSHTWDHSLTVDTTYRKYYWDGGYIDGQRNEIMGKERSMRHYKRPLTVVRANLDYKLNNHHNFNLNYHLSRTGNDRYDDLDTTFEPSNDVVSKHILGLSYNQSLLRRQE